MLMTRWVVLRVVPVLMVVLLAVTGVMVGVGRTLDNPVIAYFEQGTRFSGDLRLVDARYGVKTPFATGTGPFYISKPMWLANGEDIIFAASNSDMPQVYRYTPSTGALHTLIPAPSTGNIFDLSLAPDGEWLAYILAQGANSHVHLMNADGTATRQITTTSENVHSLVAWSPDATQMVFYSRHWTRSTWERATLVDLVMGQQRTLRQFADNVSITTPAWTADGDALLYGETNLNTGASRVMRLDITSGVAAPLLPERTAQDALSIPAPTDARVALVTYVYMEDSLSMPSSQINLLDPVTGTLQTVYTTDQIVDGAQWSPDGRYLLLNAEPPQVSGAVLITGGQLLLLDMDSGEVTLTLNGDFAAWRP